MTTSDRVRNILRVSRAARNSDLELWLIYAAKSGLELTPLQVSKLRDMASFESIRRTRQKIQESGQYPADEVVKQGRKSKASDIKKGVRYMSPEELERELGHRKPIPFDWKNWNPS